MMSVPRPAMFVAIVTAPMMTRLRDDLGFLFMVLRVEHVVRECPLL